MQVLWSRVAQTRPSCRCRSCLNAATSIARRTTSAVNRRGLKIGDIFTAAYSAVLATAAVADSKVKEKRRKEWDRLIAEVKGGNSSSKAGDGEQRHANTKRGSRRESSAAVSSLNGYESTEGATMTSGSTTAYWTAQDPSKPYRFLDVLEARLEQSLDCLAGSADVTQTAATTAPVESDDLREWIDEDDPEGLLPDRDWHRPLNLERLEKMISVLVRKLLRTVKSQSPGGVETMDISKEMRQMASRIEAMQSGGIQLPEFSYRSREDVQEERTRLHKSLVAVYNSAASKTSTMEVVVAKLCYNLLISTAPPNMITYNILVRIFIQLEQYDLGELVVRSFHGMSYHMKANPATARLFLELYTAKGDAQLFQQTVRRMQAVDLGGHDMRIERRPLRYLTDPALWASARPVREWALSNKVIHRNEYLHQKFPRNKNVFNALISGSLQLQGVRAGIRHLRSAIREGQGVRSDTLIKLITKCINSRTIRRGRNVLYAILAEWERDVASLFTLIDYNSDVRAAIHNLLYLCGIDTSMPLETSMGLQIGFLWKGSRDGLQLLIHHMHLRAIADEVLRLSANISELRRIFHISLSGSKQLSDGHDHVHADSLETDLLSRETIFERVDLALNAFDKYSVEAKQRSLMWERKVTSRLDALSIFHTDIISGRQTVIISMYYHRLSPQLQARYDSLPCGKRLSARLQFISSLYKEQILGSCVDVEEKAVDRNENMQETETKKYLQPVQYPGGNSDYGDYPVAKIPEHRFLIPPPMVEATPSRLLLSSPWKTNFTTPVHEPSW